MSDEAERRHAKRRMLEEQLRALDDEEKYNSRSTIPNTPITSTGSYPPQWAAIVSNPSSSRQSNLTSSIYNDDQAPSIRSAEHPSSSSTWSTMSTHDYHQQQYQQAQSNRPTSGTRPQQQVQSHQYPQSSTHRSQSHYSLSQVQSQPKPQNVTQSSTFHRPQSFRDLDRSSTGPSSSISPQIQSAIPTPQASTFTSANPVPLPSEHQLHDWLTDCMGQPDGLATDWRIRGKKVDMYKLLASVIRAGGSTEVSTRGWWYMLAKLLELADDSTSQAIKSSIAKQLQELFLLMLGGLEILWDKTKGTEERAALPRTRDGTYSNNSSNLRNPVPATLGSNQGLYAQHQTQQPSSSTGRQASTSRRTMSSPQQHQQQHHYVDPSKLTLPPKALRAVNNHQSERTSQVASSSTNITHQRPHEGSQDPAPFQSLNVPVNTTDYSSRHSTSSMLARPASAASSSASQQSPNVSSQVPLYQPRPSHPPQRVPDLLSSQPEDRAQPQKSPNPPSTAQQNQKDRPSSSALNSTRTITLRTLNQNFGGYQVPRISSFRELVNSGILPLPPLNQDSNLYRATWSSDPLIQYSKRCHELGHSVRKLKEGNQARKLNSEELVFWAKLLAIMAGNPSVLPPPVDDRPQSNPPPVAPAQTPSTSSSYSGPPGSFTNPSILNPPLHTVPNLGGSDIDTTRPPGNAQGTDSISKESDVQSKKRRRKSGEDVANGNAGDLTAQPKKRGRKPKVDPIHIVDPSSTANASQINNTSTNLTTGPTVSTYQPTIGRTNSPFQSTTLQTDPSLYPTGGYTEQSSLQPFGSEPRISAPVHVAEPMAAEIGEERPQRDPALVGLPSIPIMRPGYAKRGRPKGSKTVNRNPKPAPISQSQANGVEGAILVPDSQPDHGSYPRFDGLTQPSQPVSSFEGLFRTEAEQERSLYSQNPADSSNSSGNMNPLGLSSGVPISSHNILATMYNNKDQSSSLFTPAKSTEVEGDNRGSGSKKTPLSAEQKAKRSELNKIRYQKRKALESSFGPLSKPTSKHSKSLAQGGPELIPLVLDCSPRKRINLSSSLGQTSSAHLRAQDSPFTRIYRKPIIPNETNTNGSPLTGLTASQSPSLAKGKSKEKTQAPPGIETTIFSVLNQDDGYEPSPAQVEELARALVEDLGPIPDADGQTLALEGEDEVDISEDAVQEIGAGVEIQEASSSSQQVQPAKKKKPVKSSKSKVKLNGPSNLHKKIGISTGVSSSPALATPQKRGILVVEIPSSKKIARVKFDIVQPEAENEVDELDPGEGEDEVIEEQRDSSPEYQPSPEPEEEANANDFELLPPPETEVAADQSDGAPFKVEIPKPKLIKKKKVKGPPKPVDRAKVVIPMSKRRREELLSRGHYNPFRDDDSEDETLLQRRAHAGLRPVELTVQRGARVIRPSSPEPIPQRFVARPGPALLEPFASILSEQSIINRSKECKCLWKGCDAILASENLLRKHVNAVGHARQGQEEVSTERWSWNARRTTEREVIQGKWFYRCHWKGCNEPCFASHKALKQHLVARHISKVLRCPYQDCELTSPNISHLSRHVIKTHDSPSDKPANFADLSIHISPPSVPAYSIPETARTDELTTPRVAGSTHKSAFYAAKIKEKVASHCFAGADPVMHPQHPPHILQTIDDDDDDVLAQQLTEKKSKRRRLEVVVEIPLSKRRKLTEQEKRDRILRLMNAVEPAQDLQLNDDNDGQMSPGVIYESAPTPWIETDALMIEDELVLGAPTPAPFSFWNDDEEDDEEDDGGYAAGPSGTQEEDYELPLPLFGLQGDLDADEEDEKEAYAELMEDEEEEEDDENLFNDSVNVSQSNSASSNQPVTPFRVMKNIPTSLFGPPSSTPLPTPIKPFFPPTQSRKTSLSFAGALRNTPDANSPLRFGFADRFIIQPVPSSTSTPVLQDIAGIPDRQIPNLPESELGSMAPGGSAQTASPEVNEPNKPDEPTQPALEEEESPVITDGIAQNVIEVNDAVLIDGPEYGSPPAVQDIDKSDTDIADVPVTEPEQVLASNVSDDDADSEEIMDTPEQELGFDAMVADAEKVAGVEPQN
ncbi:uncharacterized protein I206_101630 [Kwoniella pini CBS 10737]|uniref:C2H2-type domain-containing protein n=1 Tax=Kwoniella pini CBS 10737 TaxID=1296096 RepID=A0A1B9HW63_9TREE|nr:uncharacterized protein I206_06400 [Kwoniella pini CBS 10737]OCF47499.1 hypothetical protein I206_06400 [Kwoniella pini CBS 10737]